MRLLSFKRIKPNSSEKITFGFHLTYSAIEGIILGVLALNEFVFIKSIHGSDIQLGVLFQFSVMVLVLSFILNEITNRVRNKKKLIFIIGLATRFPLLLLAFFPDSDGLLNHAGLYHNIFLAVFFIYYLASPFIYPVINLFLKNNYSHQHFGILYSYATTINKLIMLLITFLYGLLLDADPSSYRYVLPATGILGIISVFILTRIPYNEPYAVVHRENIISTLKRTYGRMRNIMRSNKAFRDFEYGFMFYGFAFMGTVSVITVFYEKGLGLNYSSVAFYKNSYNLLAILLLPFFGKLIGRIDPRKFSAITFASLLFYLLFIALTQYIPAGTRLWDIDIYYTLFIAMMFNGVFAATMSLLWSIGSSYFCKKEEASNYQSIHLSFTGLRSFFAPVLGIYVYQWLGFTGAFAAGILFLVISIIISIMSYKSRIS